MTNLFVLDLDVTNNPVTDEERSTVMRDVTETLTELRTTEEKAIHIMPREVYVMMVMLKEQQDALATTLTNI